MKKVKDALANTLFIVAVFVFTTKATAIMLPAVELELGFYFLLFVVTSIIIGDSKK